MLSRMTKNIEVSTSQTEISTMFSTRSQFASESYDFSRQSITATAQRMNTMNKEGVRSITASGSAFSKIIFLFFSRTQFQCTRQQEELGSNGS